MKNLIVVSVISFFAFCASLLRDEPKDVYVYSSPILKGEASLKENEFNRLTSETTILNQRATIVLDSINKR